MSRQDKKNHVFMQLAKVETFLTRLNKSKFIAQVSDKRIKEHFGIALNQLRQGMVLLRSL